MEFKLFNQRSDNRIQPGKARVDAVERVVDAEVGATERDDADHRDAEPVVDGHDTRRARCRLLDAVEEAREPTPATRFMLDSSRAGAKSASERVWAQKVCETMAMLRKFLLCIGTKMYDNYTLAPAFNSVKMEWVSGVG